MRFRFTIRDLLWLTLVVALVLGWSIDHRRFRRFLEKSDVVVDTRDSDKPYSLRILEAKNAPEWFDIQGHFGAAATRSRRGDP